MKNLLVVAVAISLAISPHESMADSDPGLLDGFSENIVDSFSGTNLLFHGAGFASTALIVKTGYDAHVHDTFKNSNNDAALPGAVIGAGIGALLTGGSLYLAGRSSDDRETIGAGFVVAQASVITVTYIVLLKVITGRAHPTNTWYLSSQEQSEQFQLGFLRNGPTAYGWPSGHVSNTVAVSSALAHYYHHKTWIKWVGVGLSAYMLYTISAYDAGQMHWFSDGVAGAFMGYAIGSTVGRNYRQRMDGITEKPSTVSWMPMAGSGYLGALFVMDF